MLTDETHTELSDAVLEELELQDAATAELLHLSMHAMAGTEAAKTIRIRALLGNQVMLILIDSGSLGSLVCADFARRVGCSITAAPAARVKIADGSFMTSNQQVHQLEWWTQGTMFRTDMRVLELGGYDAILGMDWLGEHSPMVCDWKGRKLVVPHEGKDVCLQGITTDTQHELQEISVTQYCKWSKGNDIWAVALVKPISEPEQHAIPQPPEIQVVLDQFSDVFQTPTTLPQSREYDHTVPLLPNATPVNSRPYRYSPLHKDEIERQVAEMLRTGLIKISTSPFASPVLLIQKKDGS